MVPGLPSMRNAERYAGIPEHVKTEVRVRRGLYDPMIRSSKKPPPVTAATAVRATRTTNLMRVTSYRAITSFPLEPEVLERLCSAPVEPRGQLVLTAPRCQVALGDPGRRAVADGGKLVEAAFGGVEGC